MEIHLEKGSGVGPFLPYNGVTSTFHSSQIDKGNGKDTEIHPEKDLEAAYLSI